MVVAAVVGVVLIAMAGWVWIMVSDWVDFDDGRVPSLDVGIVNADSGDGDSGWGQSGDDEDCGGGMGWEGGVLPGEGI